MRYLYRLAKLLYFYKGQLALALLSMACFVYMTALPVRIAEPFVNALQETNVALDDSGIISFHIPNWLQTTLPDPLLSRLQQVSDWLTQIGRNEDKTDLYYLISWAIIPYFAFKGFFYFWQNYLMRSLGQRLTRDLREQLFKKVVSLPVKFFNKQPSGDLISRFTVDLNTLDQAIYHTVTGPFRDFPLIFYFLGLMFFMSGRLFLITMLLLPIAAILMGIFGKQNKKVTSKRQSKYGELTSLLSETISGIRVVKAFNMETYEQERFGKENNRLFSFFRRSILIESYSNPVLEVIGASCGVVIIVYGIYLTNTDQLSLGKFTSYLLAFVNLSDPIRKLNGFTLKITEGVAALERIYEVVDTETDICDKENAIPLPGIQKGIHIDVDEFSYDGKKIALKNIDLFLEAGKITALVGSSGSGKSTLANLIPRYFDLEEEKGTIRIDDIDIRDVTLKSLRYHIALVTQEIVLFNDTVGSNISYGDIVECPPSKVIEASKFAYAHDFIEKLPDGYDTKIGEKGAFLSGGQRQRIAIARAIIKNAPILVLDEATSALDTESEKEVQGAFENLMKNKTTLVIAHRLSTIQNADVIHVMKDGEIVETGTHQDLLDREGEYFRFYKMQFT